MVASVSKEVNKTAQKLVLLLVLTWVGVPVLIRLGWLFYQPAFLIIARRLGAFRLVKCS